MRWPRSSAASISFSGDSYGFATDEALAGGLVTTLPSAWIYLDFELKMRREEDVSQTSSGANVATMIGL